MIVEMCSINILEQTLYDVIDFFSSNCFHILQTNNTVGLSSVSVKKGKGVTLPQKLNV